MNLFEWDASRSFFVKKDRPVIASVSGGRTSAMMAALCEPTTTLCFQNTGREHPACYDFLQELEGGLGRPIVWLEFRPPPRLGMRPMHSGFAVVDYKTADRSGGPFESFLETLAAYRATKGLGPIAPWVRSRICTAYMKHRVQNAYVKSLGLTHYETFIGLRADEEDRVYGLLRAQTKRATLRTPLYDAGIRKADVLGFWGRQPFDLRSSEIQGNCTGCFLKNQADLARVLWDPETDHGWWEEMEAKYPMFGGRDFVGYAKLRAEGPMRQDIEASLRLGKEPTCPVGVDAHRFRLVVIQERKRLAQAVPSFSCGCEGATALAEMDDDAEEQFLLQQGEVGKVDAGSASAPP